MTINNTEEAKRFLTEITEYFNSIDDNIADLNKQLATKEGEQEDLLHELEISKLNAIEIMKVGQRLIKTRRERRTIKDNLQLLNTIKPLAHLYYTKGMNAEIIQTIKNLDSLLRTWEDRKYHARVLKDLKCTEAKDEI